MRAIVGSVLAADAGLLAEGLTDSTIVAGNADSITARPFLVLRWANLSPGFPGHDRGPQILDLICHDVPDDYGRIDRILSRCRIVLTGGAGVELDGARVTEIHWTGTGGDLRDTDRDTILRTATFTVVGG